MAKMSRNEINRPLKLLMVLGIAIVPILLIVLQPDYGSAMAYIVATALMLYVAGIKKRYIISAILLAVMDSTAASMCRDNKMPMLVFDLSRPDNIYDAAMGKEIGTVVTEL